MSNLSLRLPLCLAALTACGAPELTSEIQAASTHGGPSAEPVSDSATSPSPTPGPGPKPVPSPLPLAYRADCDGDGIDDCWITDIINGPIRGFSAQITYTSPLTGQQFTETICNGDYNGNNPADPSDDQPCNAPACSDANGPHRPPDINFPPDGDGPCADDGTAGEVCVPFGFGSVICDCITFDPVTGIDPSIYPDDTNGDGVNDCPPPPP